MTLEEREKLIDLLERSYYDMPDYKRYDCLLFCMVDATAREALESCSDDELFDLKNDFLQLGVLLPK